MKLSLGILILMLGLVTFGCGNKRTKEKVKTEQQTTEVVYTCPMHPEIEKSEPGDCPECGMKLVEKKSDTEESHEGHMH